MRYLKKIFWAFTYGERALFIAAALLAAISGSTLFGIGIAKSTAVVPAEGGEYTEGLVGQPTYLNPVTASTEIDKSLVRLVFSNIYDVADKIDTSSDSRTWRIRLKENVRWQDGEKLTSDDVIFTVGEIQNPDANSPLFTRWQGVSAERISELELQFNLVSPYAFFGDNLKDLYILPKHLFADAPPQNWKLSDYNLKPVGSGPYEFVSYEKRPDGFITFYYLKSWDKYFGARPLVEKLNFEFFTNSTNLIGSFNGGEIDSAAGLNPSNLIELKRPYELFSFRLPDYYAVFLNQSKSLPLQDISVRQALSTALDRKDLIIKIFGGHGEAEWGPVPSGAPYYDPNIENQTSSLDAASGTLDAAGWKMSDLGFRQKSVAGANVPLELNLLVPQIDFLQKTADYLAQRWRQIGVKTDVVVETPTGVMDDAIKNRGYEMLLFGNVLGPSSDLFSFWHSSERFYPGNNLSLYSDKKADTLIESIRQELDLQKRQDKFSELQKVIVDDLPAVFLYSPDYLYLTNKTLHGLTSGFLADPSERFREAPKWYLKTARVLR